MAKLLQWRHYERDDISNHQPHDYSLNGLFSRGSKKAWKLRVTGLCEGNSPVTGEFPSQRPSNAENVSIWWRHHDPSEWKSGTHWGRATHICVSNLTTIGSDNGLSSRHYLNQCWNIINWTIGNKFQWNFNQNSIIFIHENISESAVCKMAFISSWSQCVNNLVNITAADVGATEGASASAAMVLVKFSLNMPVSRSDGLNNICTQCHFMVCGHDWYAYISCYLIQTVLIPLICL